MLKNLSNVKLLIILAVLGGIYAVIQLTGKKSRSSSYREVLVEIDTAKVTSFIIEAADKKSQLDKSGSDWTLTLESGKEVEASVGSIKSSLSSLLTIKPSRLVAKKQEKWSEYQVDSAGTKVQVFEGSEKTLDLIIGRLNVQGQNSYATYVRLADESEVYSASNFMAFSVSSDPSSYRNSVLMRSDRDSLQQITFNYPDSALVLSKVDDSWTKNGVPADSAGMATLLRDLSFVSSRNFFDEESQLVTPALSMTIESTSSEIEVKAYETPGGWVMNSSDNPESYFLDESLFDKLFKASSSF